MGLSALLASSFASSEETFPNGYDQGFFEKLYQKLPGRSSSTLSDLPLRLASRSVVRVITESGEEGGTGVLLGDDWLLTASHVVASTPRVWATSLIVTDFDLNYDPAVRDYFVFAPELGYYAVSEADGNRHLDYALIKIKGAFFDAPIQRRRLGLRACLPPGSNESWECIIVGHPSSDCEAVGRDWAYRTFKSSQVLRSTGSACTWELVLSTTTCPGFSGGPVLSPDGQFIGIMSGQQQAARPDARGRVVSAEAIVMDLRSRTINPIPHGLTSLRPPTIITNVRYDYPSAKELEYNSATTATDFVAGSNQAAPNDLLPRMSLSSIAEIESCVGYIDLLAVSDDINKKYRPSGTCFRVGHDWILTAKHVLDCPARTASAWVSFRYLDEEDFTQFQCVPFSQHVRLCGLNYFSSDDRGFSFNGKEVVLDYALTKILWPDDGPFVPIASERKRYLPIAREPPKISENVYVPQHAKGGPKAWWVQDRNDAHYAPPVVQGLDTKRLYHSASAIGGASGAPLLLANAEGTALSVAGMHTHSRQPQCGVYARKTAAAEDKNTYPDDRCPAKPYWETSRIRPDQEFSFGPTIFAIMRDLELRHQFDLSQVEGFRDAMPYFKGDYAGGAA